MSWLRLDDRFARHPKIVALTDREFRAHVKVLCYCAEFRSEIVSKSCRKSCGVTPKIARALIDAGVWEQREDGDVVVHDWARYNPIDITNSERQHRYRNAHRSRYRNAGVTEEVTELVTTEVTGTPARARPVPSLEVQEPTPPAVVHYAGQTGHGGQPLAPEIAAELERLLGARDEL